MARKAKRSTLTALKARQPEQAQASAAPVAQLVVLAALGVVAVGDAVVVQADQDADPAAEAEAAALSKR